ncbi:hypothetical protein C1N62_09720 [Nissabacter sp. SGAir0207]|nr:hypothetical protein C1N62_09720 [Nissabacter sp. SGAir0207]
MPDFSRCLRTLCALLLIAAAPQALAHAHLASAEPAANALVAASPQQLVLGFTEGVEPRFSQVTLSGPEEVIVSAKQLRNAQDDKAHLLVPIPHRLAAGEYLVNWKVVSVDGHRTQGSYRFTLK